MDWKAAVSLLLALPGIASGAGTFDALAVRCAAGVPLDVIRPLVLTESSGNPYAIAAAGSPGFPQPKSYAEALIRIRELEESGTDYSVGLGQINRRNFARLGMKPEDALDACRNLRAAAVILKSCFSRQKGTEPGLALANAFSCYNSGNFRTGWKNGYVFRVVRNSGDLPSIRAIASITGRPAAAKQDFVPGRAVASATGSEAAPYSSPLLQSPRDPLAGSVSGSSGGSRLKPSVSATASVLGNPGFIF